MAAKALDQARADLAAARQRVPVDDDGKADRIAMWRRQGALDERERIKTILTAPIAARQPRLAETYAFEISAADAIAMMESASATSAAGSARRTAPRKRPI